MPVDAGPFAALDFVDPETVADPAPGGTLVLVLAAIPHIRVHSCRVNLSQGRVENISDLIPVQICRDSFIVWYQISNF